MTCWSVAATASTSTSSRLAASCSFATEVARLRCMRGIDTLTAIGLVRRDPRLRPLRTPDPGSASFLGLVPSEDTSGEHRRQGSITKAGSSPRPPADGRSRLALPQTTPPRRRPPSPPGTAPTPRPSTAPGAPNDACTSAGASCTPSAASAPPSPRSPSPASSRYFCWEITPPDPADTPVEAVEAGRPVATTKADDCAVSTPPRGALDLRQSASDEQRSCGTQPAHISQIRRRAAAASPENPDPHPAPRPARRARSNLPT